MAQIVRKTYERDLLVGAELKPTTPLKSLVYTCENLRLGEMRLGSAKWHRKQLEIARRQRVPELLQIIGTPERPIVPEFISRRFFYQRKVIEHEGEWLRWTGTKLTKREMQIASLLRQCSHRHLAFLTVVTSTASGWYEAWQQCQKDAERLKRNIRKLYPGAIYLLLPEIDLVQSQSIPASLFPRFGPVATPIEHQLVYKVHFHGVIYVPSMTPDQVEDTLKVTPNGRRSRFYSGDNQVRAVPLYFEDDGKTPDVLGCLGYSNKRHFRPPNMKRMAECYNEWLLLNHNVDGDSSLRVSGCPREGILLCCYDCKTLCARDGACACDAIELTTIDFYDEFKVKKPAEGQNENGFLLQEPKEYCSSNPVSSLNSPLVSIWYQATITLKESLQRSYSMVAGVISRIMVKVTPWNGP